MGVLRYPGALADTDFRRKKRYGAFFRKLLHKPMSENKINPIWPDELKDYLDHHNEMDYLLIDVRQPQEYAKEHIPGAHLISLHSLIAEPPNLPKNKDLIFYCQWGIRSRIAADFFADSGSDPKRIFHMLGGIVAWVGAVLSDFPQVQLFKEVQSLSDFVHTAMNLEKGAFLYYSYLIDKYTKTPFVKALGDIAEMEIAHARLLFDFLAHEERSRTSFQDYFASMSGEIIEGGLPLEQAFQKIEEMQGESVVNSLDMALSIEYSAYDLYRSIANQKYDQDIIEVFFTLAQAEKTHIHLLAEIFETQQMIQADEG